MYAVIKTGGKQYRVEKDQIIKVELLGDVGSSVSLSPVMIVDGDAVFAGRFSGGLLGSAIAVAAGGFLSRGGSVLAALMVWLD